VKEFLGDPPEDDFKLKDVAFCLAEANVSRRSGSGSSEVLPVRRMALPHVRSSKTPSLATTPTWPAAKLRGTEDLGGARR
jgi:hypothetical protein